MLIIVVVVAEVSLQTYRIVAAGPQDKLMYLVYDIIINR